MRTTFVIFVVLVARCSGFAPGLYCGMESCYDVLNVTRDSSKPEIAKNYRKLALKFHPDRAKGEEAKKEAEETFRLVATAYETLKDDEARNDYNYFLDNPDEMYYHYYRYYRRKAPKVDVRIVIFGTIAVISLIQYISSYQKYNEAINYLMSQGKYRAKALEIASSRGIKLEKKKGKKRDKAEEKELEDAVIRKIIEENIDIHGGYKAPSLKDVLAVQIVLLPYTVYLHARWWFRWLWKFIIKREEYGEEEKLYIIRKNMKLSETQFSSLPEGEKERFLKLELWIRINFDVWKAKKEEDEKKKLAESGRAKSYRRMLKNQGPGQMTFLDEEF